MSEMSVTLMVVVLLLAQMAPGIPIGAAMALSAFAGMAVLYGIDITFVMVGQVAEEIGFNYELSIIPLFILMRNLASRSGMSARLYEGCSKLFGGL